VATYKFKIDLNQSWNFEVDAGDENNAYEELWKIIGYDGEDVDSIEPDYMFFDIDVEEV